MMIAALTVAPSATGLALPVDRRGAIVPSATAKLLDEHGQAFDCLAIGPGMGAESAQRQVLIRLIARDDLPLVLDADALNALAMAKDFQGDLRAPAVLTPHPGEFRRLAEALGIDCNQVDPDAREEAAALLAQRLGCVVVLKGAGTVVSDGLATYVNSTGNVALATAGSGDVLTGIIASLVGQFFRRSLGVGSRQITAEHQGGLSLLDCARLGVHLHGLAADRWASQHGNAGMLATDLLDELPDALRTLR